MIEHTIIFTAAFILGLIWGAGLWDIIRNNAKK